MERIYLYPKQDNSSSAVPNPYMEDLEKSLSKDFEIVNKASCKNGVIEFFQYLFHTDAYLLNWIEDLVYKRYGKIQIGFFLVFLMMKTIFKKKIIWILHNKYDLQNPKGFWVDFMYGLMMRHADLILTHSSDGIQFTKDHFPKYKNKVHYLIHPINDPFPNSEIVSKEFDILIWGSIQPYKGILEFLKFVNNSKELKNLKILLIGKCSNLKYLKEIEYELTDRITLINEVLPLDQISIYAQKCEFILFPYKPAKLLSSGVLMDSLRMHSKIIGPSSGAFKDLEKLKNVILYEDFNDLNELMFNNLSTVLDTEKIVQFCYDNSWDSFNKIFRKLYHNNLK